MLFHPNLSSAKDRGSPHHIFTYRDMAEIQRWKATEVCGMNGQYSYDLRAELLLALYPDELRVGRSTLL